MTLEQWNEFVQCCTSTDRWRILGGVRKGYVSAHDVCDHFVKPWTSGTGSGVALSMNACAPVQAQLMLSHSWTEDLTECAEALNAHCRRGGLPASTAVWFCLFSNYQAGGEDGDVGPTLQEQLAMDPFGHVIRSARAQRGMLVIHTSRAEVYERLWCVYEIATALREECATRSACSRRYADAGRRKLQDVLDVNTRNARCSCTMDELFICDRVDKSGGFERLDREIFQFRVSMLLEQAEEAGDLRSLTRSISKVEKRLESASSGSLAGSTGSWSPKIRACKWPWLIMMLASLAFGGVAVAAFAVYQSCQGSQESLSDTFVETQHLTTTTVTTSSFFDNYHENEDGFSQPSTEGPNSIFSNGGTRTTTEVSTTSPPIQSVISGFPDTSTSTSSPMDQPTTASIAPQTDTTTTGSPAADGQNTWNSAGGVTTTTGSPAADGQNTWNPAGGVTTTTGSPAADGQNTWHSAGGVTTTTRSPAADGQNTWNSAGGVTTTTGSPAADGQNAANSAGGQSTTAGEQEQTSPSVNFSLVTCLIVTSGAAATLVSLVLLALVVRRRGRCSSQAGAVEEGTAGGLPWQSSVQRGTAGSSPRQISQRVQLERLELVRQMAEERLRKLDHETGIASA